jgi:hypothetical protein
MVKGGYVALLQQGNIPEKSNVWLNIWHNDGLPKINIFVGPISWENSL